jgi:hypothetical protein
MFDHETYPQWWHRLRRANRPAALTSAWVARARLEAGRAHDTAALSPALMQQRNVPRKYLESLD